MSNIEDINLDVHLIEHLPIPAPMLPDLHYLSFSSKLENSLRRNLQLDEPMEVVEVADENGNTLSSQDQLPLIQNELLELLQEGEATNAKLLAYDPKRKTKATTEYLRYIQRVQTVMITVLLPLYDPLYGIDLRETIYETVLKKNHDYGNSFDKVVDQYGLAGAMIRITDKVNRLTTLLTTKATVKDESTLDTFLDILGYMSLIINYYEDEED